MEIKFFSYYQEYKEFSNFAVGYPITIDNVTYNTVEHYYQAMKFMKTAPQFAELIINAKSPSEAKELGHSRDFKFDPEWDFRKSKEPLKIEVMRKALYNKFTQYEYLKNLLINTNDRILKENNPWDDYWGIGKNGKGRNQLGKLLMELRSKLIQETQTQQTKINKQKKLIDYFK